MDKPKTKKNIEIHFKNGLYFPTVNGKPLKTPGGYPVEHKSEQLMKDISHEFEVNEEIDVRKLNIYSLFSTMTELGSDFENVSENQIKQFIYADPVLRSCAGPERIGQYEKWEDLFRFLETNNLEYPDFVQSANFERLEEWIGSLGEPYGHSINLFIAYFTEEFNKLSLPQKTVAINSASVHNTFIYGYLLATQETTVQNYSEAVLAGMCIIPHVFGDVTEKDYKQALVSISKDVKILASFLKATRS